MQRNYFPKGTNTHTHSLDTEVLPEIGAEDLLDQGLPGPSSHFGDLGPVWHPPYYLTQFITKRWLVNSLSALFNWVSKPQRSKPLINWEKPQCTVLHDIAIPLCSASSHTSNNANYPKQIKLNLNKSNYFLRKLQQQKKQRILELIKSIHGLSKQWKWVKMADVTLVVY